MRRARAGRARCATVHCANLNSSTAFASPLLASHDERAVVHAPRLRARTHARSRRAATLASTCHSYIYTPTRCAPHCLLLYCDRTAAACCCRVAPIIQRTTARHAAPCAFQLPPALVGTLYEPNKHPLKSIERFDLSAIRRPHKGTHDCRGIPVQPTKTANETANTACIDLKRNLSRARAPSIAKRRALSPLSLPAIFDVASARDGGEQRIENHKCRFERAQPAQRRYYYIAGEDQQQAAVVALIRARFGRQHSRIALKSAVRISAAHRVAPWERVCEQCVSAISRARQPLVCYSLANSDSLQNSGTRIGTA
eukprot:IDg19428t1